MPHFKNWYPVLIIKPRLWQSLLYAKYSPSIIADNAVMNNAEIIPNIPKYITTLTSTAKLVITGAKAKKIEGSESLDKAMNNLTL